MQYLQILTLVMALDLLFDGRVSINITQNLMSIQIIINDGFVVKSKEQLLLTDCGPTFD